MRILLLLCLIITSPLSAQAQRKALLIPIEGTIGMATGEYVVKGIQQAQASDTELIILLMGAAAAISADRTTRRATAPPCGFSPVPGMAAIPHRRSSMAEVSAVGEHAATAYPVTFDMTQHNSRSATRRGVPQ